MKLDATNVRYITQDQFRVLQAVEIGSRNHEIVPLSLICSISKQRGGGATKILQDLAHYSLISKESATKNRYEGYCLCYGGLDYLALKKFTASGTMTRLGSQIGKYLNHDLNIPFISLFISMCILLILRCWKRG